MPPLSLQVLQEHILDVQEDVEEDEDESTTPSNTSPLLEEFPVLALFESARVVLGSSKVPFECWEAHPEPRSDTRVADEAIYNASQMKMN